MQLIMRSFLAINAGMKTASIPEVVRDVVDQLLVVTTDMSTCGVTHRTTETGTIVVSTIVARILPPAVAGVLWV